jgi:hypothetical protein
MSNGLVLKVKLGHRVLIGSYVLEVVGIKSWKAATVRVLLHESVLSAGLIDVTTDSWVDILPDVQVSLGDKGTCRRACLMIRAPKTIRILREEILLANGR